MKKYILGFVSILFISCTSFISYSAEIGQNVASNSNSSELSTPIESATILPATSSNVVKATSSNAVETIRGMIKAENTQNWDQYLSYWHGFMKDAMEAMLSNQDMLDKSDGITVVRTAELSELKELTQDELKYYVSSMIPREYEGYPLKAYLANINYGVSRVTEYYYNGANYRIILLALIDDEWKVILEPEPSMEMLQNYELVGSYINQAAINSISNTSIADLDTALKIRNARIQGFVLDSDMTIWNQNDDSEELEVNGYFTRGASACKHTRPDSIKLCTQSTGKVYTVDFAQYVKYVVPSEIVIRVPGLNGESNNIIEETKAQLILAQQYGTYYTIYQKKYSSASFDVYDDAKDQAYNVGQYNDLTSKQKATLDDAYNLVQHVHLESSTGLFFLAHFVQDASYDYHKDEYYSIYQEDMKSDARAGKTYVQILSRFSNKKTDGISNLGAIKFGSYYGWRYISGNWYYYNTNNTRVTGWLQIKGSWYYFNSSGVMQTGWQQISGEWYYLYDSGVMATGWLESPAGSNTWYWFYDDGHMIAGTSRTINGKVYYFDSTGKCTNP